MIGAEQLKDAGTAVGEWITQQYETMRSEEPRIHFSTEEYGRRFQTLITAMSATHVDTLVLSSPEALCWLHGYELRWHKAQSPATWRPLTCTVVLAGAGRYITFEGEEHAELLRRFSVSRDNRLSPRSERPRMLDFIIGELRAEGALRGVVGMELGSYLPNPLLSNEIRAAVEREGATVVDGTTLARAVRRQKSRAELACVREAARACDAGLMALCQQLRPGMTELEAWAILLSAMIQAGGEPAALHETVSTGPVQLIHAISSHRELRAGEFVSADPCGVVHHYHANVARTFFLGPVPKEAREIGAIESGAFELIAELVRPGAEVRRACVELREYYERHGVWQYRSTGWIGGYEFGISFPPDWVGDFAFTVGDEGATGTFVDGLVVNFESIIGLPMIDTIICTETDTEVLSSLPRKVLEVS